MKTHFRISSNEEYRTTTTTHFLRRQRASQALLRLRAGRHGRWKEACAPLRGRHVSFGLQGNERGVQTADSPSQLTMKLVNRNEVVTSGSLVGTRNASPAGLAADEVVVALVRERVGHYGWSSGRKRSREW